MAIVCGVPNFRIFTVPNHCTPQRSDCVLYAVRACLKDVYKHLRLNF